MKKFFVTLVLAISATLYIASLSNLYKIKEVQKQKIVHDTIVEYISSSPIDCACGLESEQKIDFK
jgi:hypothetical protein